MIEKFDEIRDKIRFVSSYVQDSTTDWIIVKKEIIQAIPKEYRNLFQRRDEISKKHKPLNEFEQMVCKFWKEETGVDLEIPQEKQLLEASVAKPKSWPWTIELARKKRKDNYLKRKSKDEQTSGTDH